MGTISALRKRDTIVVPSGVEFEIQSMVGRHQKMITAAQENKRHKGFIEMLSDCIVRIGDETDQKAIEKLCKKLLSEDVRKALVEIRQLSNGRTPSFDFTYEFPSKGGQKRKEAFSFQFTEEDFGTKPYPWVFEYIRKKYAEDNNGETPSDDTVQSIIREKMPVVYNDYETMLDEQLNRSTVLPECEVEVNWKLLNGELERESGRFLGVEDRSSHTMIAIRKPTYVGTFKDRQTGQEVSAVTAVPLDELSFLDIEGLRKNILDTEARCDTTIVVQYKDDPTTIMQLDLVTIPAFFFPSMAN